MAHVDDCRLVDLRSVYDHRGTLTYVESGCDVGFEIKRLYWVFDIPSRATRAGHAHRTLRQLYVAISGSFEVNLYDGVNSRAVRLSRPDQGLTLGPAIWRELGQFSSNACLLVAASDLYDESDYVRERLEFQRLVDAGGLV